MIFNDQSGLVKLWVRLINRGIYEAEQIPMIGNLKIMVLNLIESEE